MREMAPACLPSSTKRWMLRVQAARGAPTTGPATPAWPGAAAGRARPPAASPRRRRRGSGSPRGRRPPGIDAGSASRASLRAGPSLPFLGPLTATSSRTHGPANEAGAARVRAARTSLPVMAGRFRGIRRTADPSSLDPTGAPRDDSSPGQCSRSARCPGAGTPSLKQRIAASLSEAWDEPMSSPRTTFSSAGWPPRRRGRGRWTTRTGPSR